MNRGSFEMTTIQPSNRVDRIGSTMNQTLRQKFNKLFGSENERQLNRMKRLREEYRSRRRVRREKEDITSLQQLSKIITDWTELRMFLRRKENLFVVSWFCLVLDILHCVMAVIQIEMVDSVTGYWFLITRPYWMWLLLVIVAFCQFVVLALKFISNSDNWRYVFGWKTIIELVTTFPLLITILLPSFYGQQLFVPLFLRSWMIVDRLRLLVLLQVENSVAGTPLDSLTIHLITLITVACAFIFTNIGSFQFTEMVFANVKHNTVSCLYFTIITFATVGYGDIAPKSELGRLIIIIGILCAFLFFPKLIANIVETFRSRKEGLHSFVTGRSPFVVICISALKDNYIRDILLQSFAAFTNKQKLITEESHKIAASLLDHHPEKSPNAPRQYLTSLSSTTYQIVILGQKKPSVFLESLLDSRNALEENDMKRCGVRKAAACFVLADRNMSEKCDEAIDEDHNNVLRVWSIRKYSPSTPVYVYNLRPETDVHVRPLARQVVCVTSIKQMILGYSCLHKGSAALITNLVHQAPSLQKFSKAWEVSYSDGISNSIHLGPLNPLFQGIRFGDLAWYIYAEFQVIIIGFRFRVPAEIKTQHEKLYTYRDHVVLNPGAGYVIPGDDLISECIFISQSLDDIADIEKITKVQFEETYNKWMRPSIIEESILYMNPYQVPLSSVHKGEEKICCCKGSLNIVNNDKMNSHQLYLAHQFGISTIREEETSDSMNVIDDRKPVERAETAKVTSSPELTPIHSEEIIVPNPKSHPTRKRASTVGTKDKTNDNEGYEPDDDVISPEDERRHHLLHHKHTQSSTIDGIYIGHPRPPHHMVIDNDLQSPFCHMLRTPIKIDAARISDATRKDSSSIHMEMRRSTGHGHKKSKAVKLENHILLCSNNFEIYTFLCTMRASFIDKGDLKTILILCPKLPTEEEWRPLSVFPFVYFIQGSFLKRSDMIKAGLYASAAVVIMRHGSASKNSHDGYIDSSVIMGTHQIDFMVKEKYIVTELACRNSIKLMRVKHEMLDQAPFDTNRSIPISLKPLDVSHTVRNFRYTENVPSGQLAKIDSSDNDLLYKNENTLNFRVPRSHKKTKPRLLSTDDPGYYAHAAIFAAGRVIPGDMFDGLVFESFRTPGIVDVVKLLCGRRYQRWMEINKHLNITPSVLNTIPLPSRFIGESFSTLFRHFSIDHGYVPIAIYRMKTTGDVDLNSTNYRINPTNSIPGRLNNPNEHKSPQFNEFNSIPLYRTGTGMSVASNGLSQHLFNLQTDDEETRDDYQMSSTFGQRENNVKKLAQLLSDSNQLDNELPFIVTNPLPDFVLDEMDVVFILQPHI